MGGICFVVRDSADISCGTSAVVLVPCPVCITKHIGGNFASMIRWYKECSAWSWVILMYQSSRFSAFMCVGLGLEPNSLSFPTVNARSRRVPSIR